MKNKSWIIFKLRNLVLMVLVSLTALALISTTQVPKGGVTTQEKISYSPYGIERLETSEYPSPESPAPADSVVYVVTTEELQALAKVVYREARGIPYQSHQAAVIWCILNRVDMGYWGNGILSVVTHPGAFAWEPDTPVEEEFVNLAVDVVTRWNWEKQGLEGVGRVLPKDYLYFLGDGSLNHFTKDWGGDDYWDWSTPNPYSS